MNVHVYYTSKLMLAKVTSLFVLKLIKFPVAHLRCVAMANAVCHAAQERLQNNTHVEECAHGAASIL